MDHVSRSFTPLLALTLLLLLPLGGFAALKAGPGITSKVTAASPRVKVGGTASLSVALVNQGPAVPNGVVDLEIYDAKGKKAAQHTWEKQTLAHGKPAAFHWAWKPTAGGAYTVKIGIFGSGWKPLYHWDDKALTLTVA